MEEYSCFFFQFYESQQQQESVEEAEREYTLYDVTSGGREKKKYPYKGKRMGKKILKIIGRCLRCGQTEIKPVYYYLQPPNRARGRRDELNKENPLKKTDAIRSRSKS